jgi:hypothetical protein
MDNKVKSTMERTERRIKASKKQARKRAQFDSALQQRKERLVSPSIRSVGKATSELLTRGKKKNIM